MTLNDLATPVLLGLTGGLTPGPIILLAFSEMLRSPKSGMAHGGMYLLIAALTEFCIGLFLVVSATWLAIPPIVFHVVGVVGGLILLYIAFQVYQIRSIRYQQEQKKINPFYIVLLMLLNGPLWLFWLSVCLPAAFQFGSVLPYGQYLFVLIFELSMAAGLAAMLLAFHFSRHIFSNPKIIHNVFAVLSLVLFLMAGKILYQEVSFFIYPTA